MRIHKPEAKARHLPQWKFSSSGRHARSITDQQHAESEKHGAERAALEEPYAFST
jgi:hypothetical protein